MPEKLNTAIYPGSFDPMTFGHLDIIDRGLKIYDKIYVAVARNVGKTPLFTIEERTAMVKEELKNHPNVEVVMLSGLLVDFAKALNAKSIIRGLRTVTDFEYEFQMAMMNKRLNPNIETVFLMTGETVFFVHSSTLREILSLGGNFEGLLSPRIAEKVKERVADNNRNK